jgi:hypothetical protein
MEDRLNGRWAPGTSGNPNGRPKGSRNKFTKEMKELMMKAIGKHMKKSLDLDLEEMSPKDRVAAVTAFLKFFISTRKDVKQKHTGDVKIQVNYKEEEPKVD